MHVTAAAVARTLYLEQMNPDGSISDWHETLRSQRKAVREALRASNNLTDLPAALQANAAHMRVLRHLMAPPISQDQFALLCESYSKSAENKALAGMPREAAEAAAAIVGARLDPILARWVYAGTEATPQQLRILTQVASTMMGQQHVATVKRNRLALAQESAVVQLLIAKGWTQMNSRTITVQGAVPPRHFMHKTRFASGTSTAQEVDIACGLPGTMILAMECKVTNDETNSVKRINDVSKKAAAWRHHWGSFLRTAALLQGVIAPKDVRRLLDENVLVFWSHDLKAFEDWLDAQFLP